jgi:hypothetical protein
LLPTFDGGEDAFGVGGPDEGFGIARWREEYPVATDEKKEPIRRTGFVHRFPFSRLSLDPADSFCLRASRSLLRNCMTRSAS